MSARPSTRRGPAELVSGPCCSGCAIGRAASSATYTRSISRHAIRAYLWYAKAVALAVAVYALSPIDLIPDFIPVIGYLDDLIIVPLGILLAVRLIPAEILAEHRFAASEAAERSASRTVAIVIVAIWIGLALVALGFALRYLGY